MNRCDWSTNDPEYIAYHDNEWGVPIHDDKKLFEMLILEGTQAGLSWITILKRRTAYRSAYDGFDPKKMAHWDDEKIEQLMNDQSIIRNRLKINSAKTNAKAYLEVVGECGSFNHFIWSFVDHKPIRNAWETMAQIPASTGISHEMSKVLKQKGFKFVGPTICYAYMQSVGMVNDHLTDCFRYREVQSAS